MATEQTRDEDGKFTSAPENAGLSQDDAAALERGDVAELNKDSDPRLEMMRRARETRAKEFDLEIEKPPEGEKAPEEKVEDEKKVDEPVGAAADDNLLVEIEVNGKTEKMTVAEARKRLQLSTAVVETLDQAKATREAANRELEAAKAARAIVGDPPAPKPAATGPTDAEKQAEALKTAEGRKRTARKEFAKAAQYGTDAEVETATAELEAAEEEVDKLRFASLRPEPQRDSLLDREAADTNRATADYVEKFGKDQEDEVFRAMASINLRKETVADLTKLGADERILAKLTDRELGEHHFKARSMGIVRTLDKLLDAAGIKAREELERRTSRTPGEKKDPVSERQSAKENAPTQPRQAAGRVPEPEAAKPPTSRELVDEMKRRRGKA